MAVRVRVKRTTNADDVLDTSPETRYKKRALAGANATAHSVHASFHNAKKTITSARKFARNTKEFSTQVRMTKNLAKRSAKRAGRAVTSVLKGDFAGAGRNAFYAVQNFKDARKHYEKASAIARPVVRNADKTRRSVRAAYRRGRNTAENVAKAKDIRSESSGGRGASDAARA